MRKIFAILLFLVCAAYCKAQTSGLTAPPPPVCSASNAGALYTQTGTTPFTVWTCSYYNLQYQWVVNPSYGGLVYYPTVPSTCSGSLPAFLAGYPNTTMYLCRNGVPSNPLAVQQYTVATLPSATANPYAIVQVTDGSTSADCTVGGGSYNVICAPHGSTWTPLYAGPYVPTSGATMTGALIAPSVTASVNSVINVQAPSYNASGNCSTSDSSAIQAAISAATPSQAVYLPKPSGGCYAIGSTISVATNGVTLRCEPGTTLKNISSPVTSVLSVTGNNFTLDGCTIDDNSTSVANGNGQIEISGASNPTLTNVSVLNSPQGSGGPSGYSIRADNTTGGVYSNLQMSTAAMVIFSPFQNPQIKGGTFGSLAIEAPAGGGYGNGFLVDGSVFNVQGCSTGNCAGFAAGDFSTGVSATAFAIDSSNNVTITATNSYAVGAKVTVTGFTTGTYLNYNNAGIFTVTAASSTQFTMSSPTFTHTAVTTTADTGLFKNGPIVNAHVTNTTCTISGTSSISQAFGCWSIPSYNTSLNFENNKAFADSQYIGNAIAEIGASGDVSGNVLHAMDAYSQGYAAITFYGGNVSIHDNWIYGWGNATGRGIFLYPQTASGGFYNADNASINNNHLLNPLAANTGSTEALAIACNKVGSSALNLLVEGNQINATSKTGVGLTDEDRTTCPVSATLSGNKLKNVVNGFTYGSTAASSYTLGANDFSNVTTPYTLQGTANVLSVQYGTAPNAPGYNVNGTAIAASNLSNGTTGSNAVVLANSPTLTTNFTVSSAGGTAAIQYFRPGSTGTPSAQAAESLVYDYLGTQRWAEFHLDASSGNLWEVQDTQNSSLRRFSLQPGGYTQITSAGANAVLINSNMSGGAGTTGSGGLWVYNGGTSTTSIPTTQISGTGIAQPSQDAPASITVLPASAPGFSLSSVSTGGSLVPGTTYYYKVGVCTVTGGTSLPSPEQSITLAAATDSVKLTIVPSPRATGYSIYGRAASGGELLIGSACQSTIGYTDNGSLTPSGSPPTVDTTQGNVTAPHSIATGTPTIAAGTGAGTGPTISITGTDEAGIINLTTGTSPANAATIFTVTLAKTCPTAVYPIIRSANANAASLTGNAHDYVTPVSATQWSATSNATGLTASTAYAWTYLAGCK